MRNNSTNINNTNNLHSPQIIEHFYIRKEPRYMIYDVVNPWDRHQNVVVLNLLMGFQLNTLTIALFLKYVLMPIIDISILDFQKNETSEH